MAMIPKQHQAEGARFLADRRTALLADEPRVGKTGAAIMGSEMIRAKSVLTITTASGRAVWRRGFEDWSLFGRETQILTGRTKLSDNTDAAIIGWPDMKSDSEVFQQVYRRHWDLVLIDESHYGKSFEAARTRAMFGEGGLHSRAERAWCLSGTPQANSPFDLFPMLFALAPERLAAFDDAPDVSDMEDFKRRYCKIKPKKIGFHRYIDVIIGGQNLPELAKRMEGFYLRRTQQDVGITKPIYEILPLVASEADKRRLASEERGNIDQRILEKIASGNIDGLREEHLGPVRRLWGELKVRPLVEAIKEEFAGGLDKVVIAAWHGDVMDALAAGLSKYGVSVVRGSTSPKHREEAVQSFNSGKRVFIGQIQAAGEAIDLSSSAELIFAESSFVPKDMAQMSLRITNHGQKRVPRVRVATLEGSIDEALQTVLMRKWSTINEVMK